VGWRALTGGTGSVSDRGESSLTERAQHRGESGWLQGSKWVRTVRSRSDGEGSEVVRAVRSRSDGGKSDLEGWAAAGGADRRAKALGARARSGTRGPSRSI
jgi:hypothetical protein